MKNLLPLLVLLISMGNTKAQDSGIIAPPWAIHKQFFAVLGIAQDAGYPQAGCKKSCCRTVYNADKKQVVSLGIFDQEEKKYWIIEASPDFKDQLKQAQKYSKASDELPFGVFLTHAHIGHYTGLMHFGREAIGSSNVPVYAMPRMRTFLETNGPWSQLVKLENIKLMDLQNGVSVQLSDALSITPILVPHRDEFSETVGFRIRGNNASLLFIPDIDKWEKWDLDIKDEIKKVDYAFLDATFYQNGEIWGRDMSEIPHPFVVESMATFKEMSKEEKDKIYFIHFNHTNPLLKHPRSEESKIVIRKGFNIAEEGMIRQL